MKKQKNRKSRFDRRTLVRRKRQIALLCNADRRNGVVNLPKITMEQAHDYWEQMKEAL